MALLKILMHILKIIRQKKIIIFNSHFRSKILFNEKLFIFVETFTYFYQIPYPKYLKVWTKLNNFLLNIIFGPILTRFFCIWPYVGYAM